MNYLLQRHVTRKLPAGDEQFFLHFDETARHARAFAEHGGRQAGVRAYEFGAGWDVIGPLSLWALASPSRCSSTSTLTCASSSSITR